MTWVDDLARGLGVEPLDPAEADELLKASREVAHRVERKITPLSTFVLGVALGARVRDGANRTDAFRDVLGMLAETLPQASDQR